MSAVKSPRYALFMDGEQRSGVFVSWSEAMSHAEIAGLGYWIANGKGHLHPGWEIREVS